MKRRFRSSAKVVETASLTNVASELAHNQRLHATDGPRRREARRSSGTQIALMDSVTADSRRAW